MCYAHGYDTIRHGDTVVLPSLNGISNGYPIIGSHDVWDDW